MGEHIIVSKQKNKDNLSLPAFSISNKNGFIPQEEQFGKDNTYSKTDKSSNYIVKPKYFAYNPARINVGSIAYQNTITPVLVSSLYEIFRSDNNIDDVFLQYWFRSEYFYKQIQRLQEGGVRQYFFIDKMRESQIYLTNVSEQNKIGSLISKLDKLLTLQQRKVNDLNSMKSALLQDVFPNTQGIKKIKLSTQEWNLKKISSIFKERNQRNKNGMLLSVSISKGIYPFSENDRKDNSSNDKSNYKEVKINDLAYNSMRMWQGAVGVSKYNGIVSPAYTVITPKKEENPNFYYYYFKNKRMLFNFRQHSQGLTSDTWNLKFPLFEKILIQVPSDKEEEQRVSSLFKQIDKSIELSKIQIKKLTSIKQFLLQNMFI